jgi:5-methyltetrahydrofolate--homocysteine methyltransferase
MELMAHYSDSEKVISENMPTEALSIEEKLERRIVDGDKVGIQKDLEAAMSEYAPIEIINKILLNGMKTVGELFGSGEMQLPFVLQSAETMKSAVSYLEPFMDRLDAAEKATIVLATVKGDVHDIGKNLVDIILTNNGFRVINLGIKVPIETMLHAVDEHHAQAIGMSGLLVKSTLIMKQNLALMQNRGLNVPVILGGAALTRRFVENDLKTVYNGDLIYARDAFAGLAFMEDLSSKKRGLIPKADPAISAAAVPTADDDNSDSVIELEDAGNKSGAALESSQVLRDAQKNKADAIKSIRRNSSGQAPFSVQSSVARDVPVPRAPFWGSRVVKDIPLDTIFPYVNERALFRGQWQIKRGKLSSEAYEHLIENDIRPAYETLKEKAQSERILQPAIIYGYFPCNADGNELIIYKPKHLEGTQLHSDWGSPTSDTGSLEEWQRFVFPRQDSGKYLCIADYFKPIDSGIIDICAFHIVTVGSYASEYAAELFKADKYQDYLYVHGLSVETTEAMAEYWHKTVRQDLAIDGKDAVDINRLFSQGYQGSRFSFGYPACPNLEDHEQLFSILDPGRIGISLTEEYQLVPEQSTSAIIVHHPEARYFGIK